MLGLITSNFNFVKSFTSILNFVLLLILIGQFLACVWYSFGTQTDGWIE